MDEHTSPCKIFVAGPRAVSKLNMDIQERLYSAISKEHIFLVGDANGIDKAVQRYFLKNQYKNVVVYASGNVVRNNLGDWSVKSVEVAKGIKGFEFYAVKDFEMAKDADYGFMIWNGESRGTLNDLVNLVNMGKTSLLYFLPHKKFYCISELDQVEKILSLCEQNVQTMFKKIDRKAVGQQITLF